MLLILNTGSCFLPAQRLELKKIGDCPATREGQRIFAEGYFSIDPEKGVATEGGYESMYPFSRFNFSVESNSKSKFEAAVVRANAGNNGPSRANRTEPTKNGDQVVWNIYDNWERQISFNDKVRVTGVMISDCVVKVDKIEKL